MLPCVLSVKKDLEYLEKSFEDIVFVCHLVYLLECAEWNKHFYCQKVTWIFFVSLWKILCLMLLFITVLRILIYFVCKFSFWNVPKLTNKNPNAKKFWARKFFNFTSLALIFPILKIWLLKASCIGRVKGSLKPSY